MTAERRLAALETSHSPTGLVLRWLDEAHAFGDLKAYVRSLLTEPPSEGPLDRLCREAADGARAGLRGKRAELVGLAVRTALRETVFRFKLVMRINVTTHDLLERAALLDTALSAHVALLVNEDRAARRADSTYLERFTTRRDLLLLRVNELLAAQDARVIVEERYLDGHPALFPTAMTAWEEQRKTAEALADLAVRLAEFDGVAPPEPADPNVVSARATEFIADVVEPAKATALDKLGEGEQAAANAVRWLRAKLTPVATGAGAAT